MGHGARPDTVTLVVAAIADALTSLGAGVDGAAGLAATREALP
jgi:alanine-glyoxylate transaminase/serine-glyoxylate transaminase/serine-pyruvate transaminase